MYPILCYLEIPFIQFYADELTIEIQRRPDGKEYRGLSRNQMCIGVACDSKHSILFFEGNGKTSGKRTIDAFASHIKTGSKLIHDLEGSHDRIVKLLSL